MGQQGSNGLALAISPNEKKEQLKKLKNDIKAIFKSYDNSKTNDLLKFVNSYDETIRILDEIEKKELLENPDGKKTTFIENKYRIQRIVAKYNLMSSITGIYDLFNDAFLTSSHTRRAMLSDAGAVFFSKKNSNGKKELEFFSLEKCIENNQEEELKAKIQKIVDTKEPSLETRLQLWQGCEMAMPENCEITLSFSQIYPALYIKKRNKNSTDEIFIEEHPWNINYVANEGFLHHNMDNGPLKALVKNELKQIKTHKVCITKNQFKEIFDTNNSDPEYQTIELTVLEALKKCDVVIQMPYINTRADILLKVSFQEKAEKDSKPEIILTTC